MVESCNRHTGKLHRCRRIILFITERFIHFNNTPYASHFTPSDDCDPNSNHESGIIPVYKASFTSSVRIGETCVS